MSPQSDLQSPYSNIEIQQEIARNQGQAIGQMHDSQAISVQEIGKGNFIINVRNVTFQSSRGSVQPFGYCSEREIPSLLPYLANRSPQKFELENVFEYSPKQTSLYPMICIIHGEEFQSHYKFLERLQKRLFPELLGIDVDQIAIKKYRLDWPSTLKSFDDLPVWLRRNLAGTVLKSSLASLEEINEAFCKYPAPVIIFTDLFTENWKNQGFEILEKFLEFWQNWPDLNPNQKLIICLCIKYQFGQQEYFFKNSIWWLFRYWKSFFRQRQFRHINKKVHEQLATLSKTKFMHFDRIFGVVLPELTGIERLDVLAWADSEETMKFVGEAGHEKLVAEIRDIFENQELISMEDLAKALVAKLKSLSETNRSLL